MSWRGQLLAAIQAAEITHRELGLDETQRIDVYAAADQLGLWVLFQPLGRLLGALVPNGAGGILITTQRGQGTQRFTCAHELGHWRLEHRPVAMDDERNVLHAYDRGREQAAQVFASYFLMPPGLVFACIERHNINPAKLAPEELYKVARDMGSSYEATARHLTNLDVIAKEHRDRLLRVRPAQAKSILAAGLAPRTDVWTLDVTRGPRHVTAYTEDYLAIELPENPTTGYTWSFGRPLPHRPIAPEPGAMGIVPALEPLPQAPRIVQAHVSRTARQIRGAGSSRQRPELPSSPQVAVATTAYIPAWVDHPEEARRPQTARRARHRDERRTSLTIGGTGRRLLVLELRVQGNWLLPLNYSNPFNRDAPLHQIDVSVTVRPREPAPYQLDATSLAS